MAWVSGEWPGDSREGDAKAVDEQRDEQISGTGCWKVIKIWNQQIKCIFLKKNNHMRNDFNYRKKQYFLSIPCKLLEIRHIESLSRKSAVWTSVFVIFDLFLFMYSFVSDEQTDSFVTLSESLAITLVLFAKTANRFSKQWSNIRSNDNLAREKCAFFLEVKMLVRYKACILKGDFDTRQIIKLRTFNLNLKKTNTIKTKSNDTKKGPRINTRALKIITFFFTKKDECGV